MEFGILGPLVVRSDAGETELGGSRPRALLAVLLMHPNEPVSAERLAMALFGEDAPAGAVKTVRVHVSRLRRALGDPDALATTADGYRLRVRPGELDAERFERLVAEGQAALRAGQPQRAAGVLREALTLWRGPPFGELERLPLAAAEIARLEEQRLAALQTRVEADLAAGRHAELIGELRRLVAEQPLRERLHELLMLALYRSSRQAEALDAYRRVREEFVEELGLEPGLRLRELERAILEQDPRLDAPPVRAPGPPASAFVGREPELAALTAGLDQVLAGSGRVFLVSGEPGIGKTRLAEELAVHAEARGARVLVGRCWEAGGAPAYWPWVQSLRALASAAELTMPGVGAAELVELVPELRERFPALPAAGPLSSEGARFRVFEAVAQLLRDASETRPIVLVIDDLHAADAPSLLLLRFVSRCLHATRVLLLCAYRDVDPVPGSALVEALAEVSREPIAARLELGPLSVADVGRYVALTAAKLASPETIAALYAQTEGNPLFVGETVRLLAAEGAPVGPRIAVPQSVRDVVARRVARLTADCGAMLTLASVLGREFDLGPLARLCDVDETALLEGLDEALAAQVLVDVPGTSGRLRFAHMVIRDALYQQLTSVRCVQLHRRALAALEQTDGDPAELAHHAAAAHDDRKRVHYAQRAGDRALSVLAYEEAARLYRAALESAREDRLRCELLLSLGYAEIRAGDTSAGKQAFREAAALAEQLRLPRELARAAFGYGGRNVFARAGSDDQLVPLLERALAALGNTDPELRVLLLSRLAGALRDEPSRERRDRLSLEAVELARRATGSEVQAYALEGRVAALIAPDTVRQCLALGREMEEAALSSGDPEQVAAAHTHQLVAQVLAGDLAGANRRAVDAVRAARELRQPARTWVATAVRAVLELAAGHLELAEQLISEALAVGERAQPDIAIPTYHLQRHSLLELKGPIGKAEPGIVQLATQWPTRSYYRCALAHIYVANGRRAEAKRELDALTRDDCAALPFDIDWLLAMSLLAETCAWLDDSNSAPVLYRRLLPWAGLNAGDATDGIRGSVSRYLGLLATTLDRFDEADSHYGDAEAANERMGARPWLAYTRHDHGRMLLWRGRGADRERARRHIEAALHECRELAMTAPDAPDRTAAPQARGR